MNAELVMLPIDLVLGLVQVGLVWMCAVHRRWSFVVVSLIAAAGMFAAADWERSLIDMRAALQAECRAAPAVVPFHQGMTLCPGQSAIVRVPVPLPQPAPADLPPPGRRI